ncbi:MAG: response regulator transcription factor [Chloroflexi bacterium]|nr:response regulator transcription factor [Chloroflexota bacterium]
MSQITILLVDDHDAARRELAARLEREPDLQIVAQVAALADARVASATLQPRVILADVKRRDGLGIELIRHLRLTAPDASLIVLTSFFDERERAAVLKFGASAYLLKEVDTQQLVAEIKKQAKYSKGEGAPWVQV